MLGMFLVSISQAAHHNLGFDSREAIILISAFLSLDFMLCAHNSIGPRFVKDEEHWSNHLAKHFITNCSVENQ